MATITDTIVNLPIFQGVSVEDFNVILSKVKFNFRKYESGEYIAQRNTECNDLIFLLKGELEAITVPEKGNFTYYETVTTAPYAIEPESLFGVAPFMKSTYIAKTAISTLSIEKKTIVKVLMQYDVVRLNLLNMICSRACALHTHLWDTPPRGTKQKIAHFFFSLANKPEGEKRVDIKMEALAEIVDETRLNVSRVLNELQSEGIIKLGRKTIYIDDLSKML